MSVAISQNSKPKRLIVFGGGPLPEAGLDLFLQWASESASGRIPQLLYIAWASEVPEATAQAFRKTLRRPVNLQVHLHPPSSPGECDSFLGNLENATAVFFSGGDQKRIARVLSQTTIKSALHEAYANGVPFAGTSAGTAVMSQIMISKDNDPGGLHSEAAETDFGLGLVEGMIFDQHFLKRQRQNRLFSIVLKHPKLLGVGVDEGAALAIENDRHARVLGPERVMLVMADSDKGPKGALRILLVDETQSLDLVERDCLFTLTGEPRANTAPNF